MNPVQNIRLNMYCKDKAIQLRSRGFDIKLGVYF